MLRLIGIVISIGLADSLNPSTIGPALYMATGERGRGRVAEFTAAVFAVYFVGGAAIALGAGALLRPIIPHPHHHIANIIEVAVGIAMIAAAAMLWRHRHRLAHRDLPDFDPHGKSSWVLGASITAIELPTAFPYFAAIAAILASGLGPLRQLGLLIVFNVCFVLPLIAIICVLTFAGDRSGEILARCRRFLERRWPQITAVLLIIVGVLAVLFGATGLAAQGHNRFGRFFRHVRHMFHLHP
jgi:cytochrome c biogenesis protein CcdA